MLTVVYDTTGVSVSEVNTPRLLDEEEELSVSARRRDKRDAQSSRSGRVKLWGSVNIFSEESTTDVKLATLGAMNLRSPWRSLADDAGGCGSFQSTDHCNNFKYAQELNHSISTIGRLTGQKCPVSNMFIT